MELLETHIWWLGWSLYYVTREWLFTGLDFCTSLLSAALLSVVGLCNHLHLMPIYVFLVLSFLVLACCTYTKFLVHFINFYANLVF